MSHMQLSTGQVITLGDGRLACEIGEVYDALNGLLDDNLMTHQLVRAGRFVKSHVIEAHPWVAELPELPDLNQAYDRRGVVTAWINAISAEHGNAHYVPDLSGQWIHLNPMDELEAQVGRDRIIAVVKNDAT